MKPGDLFDYKGFIIQIKVLMEENNPYGNYLVNIVNNKMSKTFTRDKFLPVILEDEDAILSYNFINNFCTPITNPKEIRAIKALFL